MGKLLESAEVSALTTVEVGDIVVGAELFDNERRVHGVAPASKTLFSWNNR